MQLSKKDLELYFELMWSLLFFVNQQLKLYPAIKKVKYMEYADMEERVALRDALYENIGFVDSFIKQNPYNFSEEKLLIIAGWKNVIGGEFFVERFLKNFTVFIQDETVYAVLGLRKPLSEIIPRSRLPLYINTYLLPFKGKIVYDGVYGSGNFYFGGGIKEDLRETYMRAKQNQRIIHSLEPAQKTAKKKKAAKTTKNWKPELKALVNKSKKLRSTADSPAIYSPGFSLAKASIQFAELAVTDPDDVDGLYAILQKAQRSLNKAMTVLNRTE